jgi:hypothetical protein
LKIWTWTKKAKNVTSLSLQKRAQYWRKKDNTSSIMINTNSRSYNNYFTSIPNNNYTPRPLYPKNQPWQRKEDLFNHNHFCRWGLHLATLNDDVGFTFCLAPITLIRHFVQNDLTSDALRYCSQNVSGPIRKIIYTQTLYRNENVGMVTLIPKGSSHNGIVMWGWFWAEEPGERHHFFDSLQVRESITVD